jgi:uncharacterized protein YkwD
VLPVCRDFATLEAPPVIGRSRIRIAAALALAALALLVTPAGAMEGPAMAPPPVPALRTSADSLAAAIRLRIDAVRQSHGLRSLRAAPGLGRSARLHAHAMAARGFFSHDSTDGASAGDRIRRYYAGSWVGETLLWRSPGVTAQQVVAMWMASPPHRRVLLLPAFRDIGIGVVRASAAPGAFGGLDVTIVVADFGAP